MPQRQLRSWLPDGVLKISCCAPALFELKPIRCWMQMLDAKMADVCYTRPKQLRTVSDHEWPPASPVSTAVLPVCLYRALGPFRSFETHGQAGVMEVRMMTRTEVDNDDSIKTSPMAHPTQIHIHRLTDRCVDLPSTYTLMSQHVTEVRQPEAQCNAIMLLATPLTSL